MLEIPDKVEKKLRKLKQRYPVRYAFLFRKVCEILKNPQHYKNLRGHMKTLKRVHIDRSFVLTFSVDETLKTVTLEDLEHPDRVYQ